MSYQMLLQNQFETSATNCVPSAFLRVKIQAIPFFIFLFTLAKCCKYYFSKQHLVAQTSRLLNRDIDTSCQGFDILAQI